MRVALAIFICIGIPMILAIIVGRLFGGNDDE